MATLIHQDSPICVKSELDLFSIPSTQAAIEFRKFVEYFPLSNIRDGSPVEFHISGSGDEYLDLADSYIHVKAKITKSDGAPLPDNEPVAPVNLFLHSLFSQVDVSLNDRIISSASNTYPYRAYLETLLNYGEDAKKSLFSCEAFFKDDKPYQVDPVSEVACESLKKRYQLMANSRTLDMIGQLHCDIFQQNRLMLNLVDMKIKMIRSKPNFCLLSTNNSEYNVVLEHASLFVRKVKVSPGVSLGHAKALEKTSAKNPIDRVVCKTYSIPKGSLSFMQDNVFLGSMPKRLIITFVKNAAINGQYSLNPFNFKHHKLNFLGIYLDGQPVPCKPMELNYESENYIRAYHSLFSGFNRDKGIYISREEFSKVYAIYSFDLTPDLCDGSHFNLLHQGNLRVEAKFARALEETVSVLVYAEFQNIIEITKSRHVLCDFAN
ncbi:Uncharacterized protein F54H12.2 [Araneus ventricosus]|uniref:Uncharacterized protein F54H12.2 n=1 Tax=Araneus ventricosus TaxID=182803 RepID=A0A4Y2E378_ARAVE|nr:Uncharacterized protein F54H12.2 [Araneus ventricosus]